ncbi:peptide ABC transporter substrate-binding protein [Gleimia hominis]|uniref:peptide ABC transporter substrate-binding protein n=1 Tax=Gleimia hominis TaxID=595468 RepID=UPI000C801F9B|nr:ABC transporter substrate-binding protein [Gleimia hominis]WIK64102.1 ABC transporter substrate-binding protein [Gleimia hominis]
MNLKRMAALAATAALALTTAACGSGGDNESGDSGATGGSNYVTLNGTEPQSLLIPSATNEVGGGRIIDMVFAGLVYYDEKGEAHNEIAESIDANGDSTKFDIKLKKGLKFSDDTEVKADNFIKAWNDAGKLSNARLSGAFMEPIKGYSDKEDSELTGLKKVDDYHFTVELNQPTADFPLRLGYSAFAPLPDSAFDNDGKVTDEFGENPVGYGPYKMKEEGAWEHNVQATLVPNPNYQGDRKPQNDGLVYKFYTKMNAAYADVLADNLDVLDAVDESAFATYEQDVAGRFSNKPVATSQSFSIPYIEHFQDDEEGRLRRQAISMAIDRDEITSTVFHKTRTPAKDFSAPVINGYTDKLKGNEVLQFNPEKAKELWQKADEIAKFSGTFEIAYNADGGHQGWADAVSNSIKNTLGINAQGKSYPDFKSLRTEITDRTIKTAFRTGWQADYPGLSNFLTPIFKTNGSANDVDYSNPEFDKLLNEGDSATSVDDANQKYQQAEEILLQELPSIPTWYDNSVGAWSTNVDNVVFNWQGVPEAYKIVKK